jgi:cobalt/nickel transport system ATP-binding protein
MELLDIANLRDKAPYHLSGGQKKRVAIAAILALNPEVFIMDEPLNGLDQKTHERMVDLIRDLKAAGKTLVIATHDDEFAQDIGDRQVNLSFT